MRRLGRNDATAIDLLVQERRELADLLHTLTPEQWNTESLCTGWRVRDVVAHLLYDATPALAYLGETVRTGGSSERLNDLYIRRGRSKTIEELSAAFETTVHPGPISRFAPRITLADTLIHHQDIRRPLALPRRIPDQRLLTLLRHPDPFLRPGRRMRGLRFHATDVAWSRGAGPVIEGPGEAIVMAIAGRATALTDLTGPGVDILRARISPSR